MLLPRENTLASSKWLDCCLPSIASNLIIIRKMLTHKYLFPKCAHYSTVLDIFNLYVVFSGFNEVEIFFPI